MRALTLNADAREINQLHGEILAAAKTTIEKAIRIGELLTARKEKCPHGAWLPWTLPFLHALVVSAITGFFPIKSQLRMALVEFGSGEDSSVFTTHHPLNLA